MLSVYQFAMLRLSIDHAQFPHPLIHRPERVLKRLVPMQPEIAQRRGPRLVAKAVERLAVHPKRVALPASQPSTT